MASDSLCFSASVPIRFQLRFCFHSTSSIPSTLTPSLSPSPSTCDRVRVWSTPTALAQKAKVRNYRPTIQNRPATFRFEILEQHECGIELLGTEIKSVREGSMNLKEGYARVKDGELFLHNVHISPWTGAHKAFNHEPLRPRRLLLHKRIIRKLGSKQMDAGLTLIPLRAYFSKNNYLKVEIGLARGKKLHDKREVIKQRDNQREIQRAMKAVM